MQTRVSLLGWVLVCASLLQFQAQALIVGPYSRDANTLHLWHLDEAAAPALDSAPGGTNLTALGNGATLGNASFTGFGTALSTSAATNAYLAPRPLVDGTGDDCAMAYADPVTGAFTYEAIICVQFDPATNFSRSLPLYLLTGDNDSGEANSARAFQFRILPNGTAMSGTATTDYRLHFYNAKDNGSYFAVIPRTGTNALAVGNWYHVAVTYDGNEGVAGNTKLYWTLLAPNRVQANQLAGTTLVAMTDLATNATPDFTLGNIGRMSGTTPQPNSDWPGLIDEVRVSNIARSPLDLLFNSTNPLVPVSIFTSPASQAVYLGQAASLQVVAFGNEPLAYQWWFNGAPLAGATRSLYALASAQPPNEGEYQVVVTNALNAATSAIASLAVRYVPVSVVTNPESQVVEAGLPAGLSVTAVGSPPLTYQWRLNGAAIAGATQTSYRLAAAQLADWGSYDVVVANSLNAATSAVATLNVAPPGPVCLSIAQSGPDLVLSWPMSLNEWLLEGTFDLGQAAAWRAVTNPVVVGGNQERVTLANSGSHQSFRLAALVRPVDWSAFTAGPPAEANAQRVASILQNACKYAMTTWWSTYYAAQDATNYLDFGGTDETHIRRPAMEAYGLAVALQTGLYDPIATGVSATTARGRALKLVRSLGYRHLVSQTGGWGNVWQSAHWAALTGTAGWLLWTNLSATDQLYVRRAVEYEANRFTNYAVPYYMNRAGSIIYPGDTKAEENAWNASVLHLALCMMPAHTNGALWWNKALELTLSTHARPSDLHRTNVYHGRSLAAWLNGSNANEDSTVLNHSIVHPDYMVAGLGEFQPALVYLLAGKPVPQASFFNLDQVYAALVDLNFVVGAMPYPTGLTNRPPGGPMYMRSTNQPSGEIYYPNGNDWGTSRRMHFATFDATIGAFGLDTFASLPAASWESQHDQWVLDMQARFSDGRTYGASSEDTYALREEWVCNYAAKSYLTKWLVHQGPFRLSNAP
jgi:hypothetical protein